MPFNKLHVPDSFTPEKCHEINALLHECLVSSCAVNPDDNFCLVTRYAAEDMILHPTFLGEREPAATIVVEIVLLAGRSDAQKETLYKSFREGLAALGLKPNNSIMYLVENSPSDWSFSDAGSVKKVLGL